jgi:hypothetical protein
MAGLINKLQESLLGHEVSLPICSFKRAESFRVFYAYLEDQPLSHSLVFRKGGHKVFEIFLPGYGEDIEQLIANTQYEPMSEIEANSMFSLPVRLFLRLIAGKVVSGCTLLTRSRVKLGLGLGPSVNISYRLALCRRGINESVILLSSIDTAGGSNSSSNESSWLKLSTSELKQLIQHLEVFLLSREFAEVPKGIRQSVRASGSDYLSGAEKRPAQLHHGGKMTARTLIDGKIKGLRYLPGISIGVAVIITLICTIIREWWPVIIFMVYSMIFCWLFAVVKRRMGCPNCGRSLYSISEEYGLLAFTIDSDAKFCPYCGYDLDSQVEDNTERPDQGQTINQSSEVQRR